MSPSSYRETSFQEESRPSSGEFNVGKLIKWLVISVVAVLILSIGGCSLFNVTRVDAGHVGLEINLAGSQRGVQDIPIRTGWVFYSPIKTRIVEFPTYMQTVKWTKDTSEGHPTDEHFEFNSQEGMVIGGDFGASIQIDPARAPWFYVKYRLSDTDLFIHGPLKNIIRQKLNKIGSTFPVEDIYGAKKGMFLLAVEQAIQDAVKDDGVIFSNFGFISAPSLPANIVQSIQNKTTAITNAEAARNQLAVTQAEMAKVVAEADGNAKATIARANGDAEANKIRTQSITPAIIRMTELENERFRISKWNGDVPRVVMGDKGGSFLQLTDK